jgi:hypothetical protein
MHMQRTSLAALTALALLLVGAAPAGAAVQRSVSTFSVPVTSSCDSTTGTLSGTETATTVFDVTDEHLLFQGSARVDETFTPDAPGEPVASGHGTFHFTFVANDAGGDPFTGTAVYTEVQTDVFHASGETAVIHHVVHTSVVDGTLVVSIDRAVVVCQGL